MSAVSLDDTIGVVLIGVLISGALWGVSCMQGWHYLGAYPDDGWALKTLVGAIWALDTFHQLLISHAAYTYVITHFADEEFLFATCLWSLLMATPVQALIAFAVQLFFAGRVWRLSRSNLLLTGAAIALALAQLSKPRFLYCTNTLLTKSAAALVLVTARSYDTPPNWVEKAEAVHVVEQTGVGLAVATNVFIASSMAYLLQWDTKEVERTESLHTRLTTVAMSTGLITMLCALGVLISYYAAPGTLAYLMCSFIIGRLYTNSFLASLNLRRAAPPGIAPPAAAHTQDTLVHAAPPHVPAMLPGRRAPTGVDRRPASSAFPSTERVGGAAGFRLWRRERLARADVPTEDAYSDSTLTGFAGQAVPMQPIIEAHSEVSTPSYPLETDETPIFEDHPYRMARVHSTFWED